jgi:hypothetical protein
VGSAPFKGRKAAIRHFYVPGVSALSLQDLGGVFMFGQNRNGLGQRRAYSQRRAQKEALGARQDPNDDNVTHDPREILVDLASRAQASQGPQATEHEEFERLREL